MYIVSVAVFVTPPHERDFIAATLDNARNTRHEPGNLRFDVSQSDEDPTRFLLYEAYKTKEDFATHQQTPHYVRWKETVAPWMAQPRVGVKHHSIFFDNSEQ